MDELSRTGGSSHPTEPVIKQEVFEHEPILVKREPFCDDNSKLHSSTEIVVKQELDDAPLGDVPPEQNVRKIENEAQFESESIVKDELIIEDSKINSELHSSTDIVVKQELEDAPLGDVPPEQNATKFEPESIVKSELIIDDSWEPMEDAEKEKPKPRNKRTKGNPRSRLSYTCRICQHPSQSKKAFMNHAYGFHNLSLDQIVASSGMQKCPFCDYCAFMKLIFRRHMETHYDKETGKWHCVYCDKNYKNRQDLRLHVLRGTCKPIEETPMIKRAKFHKCEVCDKTFRTQNQLKLHSFRHQAKIERKYQCEICGKRFLAKAELVKHARRHARLHPTVVPTGLPQYEIRDEDGLVQCSECPAKLSPSEDYVAHYKWHMYLQQLDIKCERCGKLFESNNSRKEHKKLCLTEFITAIKIVQTDPDKFQCSECESDFTSQLECFRHIRVYHPSGFRCYKCGKCFESREMLERHEENHVGELDENGKYRCNECPAVYAFRYQCLVHMRRHAKEHEQTEGRDFQCSECDKMFFNAGALARHVRWHRIFTCKGCNKTFDTQQTFMKHNLAKSCELDQESEVIAPDCAAEHEEPSLVEPIEPIPKVIEAADGTFKCSGCESSHTKRSGCNRHIRLFHPSNFRCETCGLFWESEEQLLNHEKKHEKNLANSIVLETNGSGMFKCNECPQVFSYRTACVNHVSNHGKKRAKLVDVPDEDGRFRCKVCAESFESQEDLEQHKPTHAKAKPIEEDGQFKCAECGKLFETRQRCAGHIRWAHCRKKLYQCGTCEKTFDRETAKIRHEGTHDVELFPCETCPRVFKRRCFLLAHQLRHTDVKTK